MASQKGHNNIPLKVKVPVGAEIWVLKDRSILSGKKTKPTKNTNLSAVRNEILVFQFDNFRSDLH